MNEKGKLPFRQKLLTKNKKNDADILDSICENNDFPHLLNIYKPGK
jgi:hypothetical protein